MDFSAFDTSRIDEYADRARANWGKTEAYKEYQQKSKERTAQEEEALGKQVMDFFVRLGKLRPCAPDSDAAHALHWYLCY